jgi:hypothetical protein
MYYSGPNISENCVGFHRCWDCRRSYWDQVSANRHRQIDLMCLLSKLVGLPLRYDHSCWDWSISSHMVLSELVGLAYILQLGASLSLGLQNPFLMRSWLQEAHMDEGQFRPVPLTLKTQSKKLRKQSKEL